MRSLLRRTVPATIALTSGEVDEDVTDVRLGRDWQQVGGEWTTATEPDAGGFVQRAGGDGSRVGVAVRGGRADADNFSAARLYDPVDDAVPAPELGALDPAYSDEFSGSLDPAWSWVRQDPEAGVSGGSLVRPTQAADLVGGGNDAAVLLRDAPTDSYLVETKLTIDLGTDSVRNYQQGGLVAYVGDDEFLRLSHVAIWNTRQTEFGKEVPYAGRLMFGGMLVGTPAETTWLRLAHSVDPENGELELRAATSCDGTSRVWGGTWTLPADSEPRIGLVSHGGEDPQATARFDYLRVYR